MSAKKHSQPSNPAPSPAPASPTTGAATAAPDRGPWIDSRDPRRRLYGRVALAALWIYVAALWLLALDQWFNWGIFGPKVPPI